MGTQQNLIQQNYQTLTYLSEDFLARLSALLAKEKDLTTPEARYSLTSLGFSPTKDQDIWCLKTSKVYLVTTREKLSRQYLGFLPTWGMELNGRYLTAKDGFHKIGNGSSLSDILEENVDEKYYLSQELANRLLKNIQNKKVKDTESTVQAESAPPSQVRQEASVLKQDSTSPTIRATYHKGWQSRGPLIKGMSKQHKPLLESARIRRLTPLECERLMGWEDNWTAGVSDTQRYKQCGNGIIAPMVTDIIKKMEECLA